MCGTNDETTDKPAELPQMPLGVLVAIGVGMLTILVLFFMYKRKSKGKRDALLIMGPTGSGKTTLYLQLKEGSTKNGSVSSMEQNIGTFIPTSAPGVTKPMTFVDLPGHPRLADKLEDYIHKAVGIIFLIDAADFIPHTRTIAEQLYRVMSHPEFQSSRIPLLIACNKNDLGFKVHTESFIEKKLQREITSVRSTQSTLDGETAGAPVGKMDVPFKFEDVPSKTGICKISALNGEDEIEPINEFVAICARQL